jgi:hypothetical protein
MSGEAAINWRRIPVMLVAIASMAFSAWAVRHFLFREKPPAPLVQCAANKQMVVDIQGRVVGCVDPTPIKGRVGEATQDKK